MDDVGQRDCAMFFMHVWSPRIAAHYERLKREASPVLDVVLCFNQGASGTVPDGMAPDIVVDDSRSQALFPARFAHMKARSGRNGYYDLAWLAGFLDPRLSSYDRFWMVEFDVDFSGNWATFFSAMRDSEADLLVTRIRYRSDDPDWRHWPKHRQPEDAPTDPMTAFFPLGRFSRRLVEDFRSTVASAEWDGHNESVMTTIAAMHGRRIEEISGDTSFTPPARRNRFYVNGIGTTGPASSTFDFRPPRAFSYFGERPRAFRQPDRLYHPVKVDRTFRQRLKFLEMIVRRRLKGL